MKKFYKICGVIIFIGIILLVAGKINHGNKSISDVHSGFFTSINNGSHRKKESEYHYQTINTASFTKVKFSAFQSDVRVTLGKKYQVKISGSNIKNIAAKVKNKELFITDQNDPSADDCDIVITVPQINSVKKISGSSSDGDILLNDLNIPQIDLKQDTGDLVLKEINTRNAQLFLDSGDLKISNSKFKINAALQDGDAKISDSEIIGNSYFKMQDGDFNMTSLQEISSDFYVNSDSKISYKGRTKSLHYTHIDSSLPKLKVVCREGDINIA